MCGVLSSSELRTCTRNFTTNVLTLRTRYPATKPLRELSHDAHRGVAEPPGDVPVEDPDWDVGVEEVLSTPYLGNADIGGYVAPYDENLGVSYDRIPKGEAEVRRASDVISADGKVVGHVDGFVVGDDDETTHL